MFPRKSIAKLPCRSPALNSVSFISSYHQTIPSKLTPQDIAHRASSLINQPNWKTNETLKSFVSHMNPNVAAQVILLQNHQLTLALQFFQWVCQHSTYCYDTTSRIHLLKLLISSNSFRIAHKAVIELIKSCGSNENGLLKLMQELEEMRKNGFRLNYPCYSILLMSIAKLSLGFLAFSVYKRMVAEGFAFAAIDYGMIINAFSKVGFVRQAEMFMSQALKLGFGLGTHICTSLVLGYCREKDLWEAFRVFDVMSESDGCGANSVTYSILIHGLCENGRVEEAFALKEGMSQKGCQPSTRTYTVLVKALCDDGSIGKALDLVSEMIGKGCKPNVYTYTVLIDGLCREGKIEEGNGMLKQMVKEGVYPGIVTYNALINGYCKEGKIVSAFELLSLMEKRNCRPNIRTYNELIEGLCRVNKPYKAMLLLGRIVNNGLLPNCVSYNILIYGFCKEGHFNMASKIFELMNSFGVDTDAYSFTAMIDGLCKQGRLKLANGLLGKMIKKGIEPDEVTFTALMDGFCKIGNTRDASKLLKMMIENGYLETCHAFNSILHVLSKECDLIKEYALFGKILKHGLVPSVVTYTILVGALFRAGKVDQSLGMMELMKHIGCPPGVYTYNVMVYGLCQIGRVEDAERILHNMSDLGVPPNHVTYTIFVKAHVYAGRLDRALEIVSVMVRNGFQPNSRVYYALLVGVISSNKTVTEANSSLDVQPPSAAENCDECVSSNILKEMDLEHAFKLRVEIEKLGASVLDLYNFLIAGFCEVGRIADAEHLTKDILKQGLYPDKACFSVIDWHSKKGNCNECLEFLDLILSHGFLPSLASYSSVIHCTRVKGNIKEAQRLLSDLTKYNNIGDVKAVLPHIEFLVNSDEPEKCIHLLKLIEQMVNGERPVI
ncbi:Pentatricopeptide repeat-containing protein [Hibiscus syriacus]|uniref:Pentatricopeptide repeat-containing protein n=1 Tax=Hibiscus syriacus TaxID=106335 RepID=A0A6A2XSS5_HIBSY|nr:pentatricopeptide repeat-containing protein At3g07290, mitochondrial [Hibiscus syriacus]KAE8659317.1 Pentatricopeptide repeat-containing protein [Hibiscus syriacus]